VLKILILSLNFPQIRGFIPKFCIFRRQFSDKTMFSDNFPTAQNCRGNSPPPCHDATKCKFLNLTANPTSTPTTLSRQCCCQDLFLKKTRDQDRDVGSICTKQSLKTQTSSKSTRRWRCADYTFQLVFITDRQPHPTVYRRRPSFSSRHCSCLEQTA